MVNANQKLEGRRIGVCFYNNGPVRYGEVTQSYIGWNNEYSHHLKLDEPIMIDGDVFENIDVRGLVIVEVL